MQYTVTNRLIIMLLCGLLAIVGVGTVGLMQMQHIKSQLDTVQSRYAPAISACDQAALSFSNVRRASVLYTNASSDAVRATAQKQLSDGVSDLRGRFADLQQKALGLPDEKQFLDQEAEVSAQYLQMTDQLIADMNAPGADIHAVLATAPAKMGPVGARLLAALDGHSRLYAELMARSVENSAQVYASARWAIGLCAVVALAVLALLGITLIREIRQRLNGLSGMMDEVSHTLDFTTRIRIRRMDELGRTADAFNRLVQRQQENLLSISTSAGSVTSAAEEMAQNSTQVAVAAGQQSESASSMAATLEEITVSINHVADAAVDTNQVVTRAGDLAQSGEQTISDVMARIQAIATSVDQAAEQIRSLEAHSAEISGVIRVIKDVADQTNLLALNAAIEAARAGESGRGFAVVADEVRKLAERTSHSTQEITNTVETMRESASAAVGTMEIVVEQVTGGVSLAQEANGEIGRIGSASREAVTMVGDITQSIREQGAAANNISVQVERIAQMSEESSAAAANNAQVARKLDELARAMLGVISAYRLGASGTTAR